MLELEELNRLFRYEDGKLIRNITINYRAKKGDEAGCLNTCGYMVVRFDGKLNYVHRIIFLMINGFLPKFIDHIDGNRNNNKIKNLRSCTKYQNCQNSKMNINNKSGIKGVCWDVKNKKWLAYIQDKGKRTTLGRFLIISVAENAINKYRKEVHGDFANNG